MIFHSFLNCENFKDYSRLCSCDNFINPNPPKFPLNLFTLPISLFLFQIFEISHLFLKFTKNKTVSNTKISIPIRPIGLIVEKSEFQINTYDSNQHFSVYFIFSFKNSHLFLKTVKIKQSQTKKYSHYPKISNKIPLDDNQSLKTPSIFYFSIKFLFFFKDFSKFVCMYV